MFSQDSGGGETKPNGHAVQFYGGNELSLVRNVGLCLWEGLEQRSGVLVIATEDHTEAFQNELRRLGASVDTIVREGRLVFLNAHETLARFIVDGYPDWSRFEKTVGAAMRDVSARADNARVYRYGEMMGILWEGGQVSAALRLEQFWNKLLESMPFTLFCAYPIDIFSRQFDMSAMDDLLCAHTHVHSSGGNGDLDGAIHRAIQEVLGPRADGLRPLIKGNYRPAWALLPKAEGTILWLRNNLPDAADRILDRARELYRLPSH